MKRFLIVSGLILALAALPALALSATPAEVAKTLAANYQAGKAQPLPSTLIKGLDERGGYEIQGLMTAALIKGGEKVVGYKAGLTSPPALKKFGAKGPVTGVMLGSMLHSGAKVNTKGYTKCMLEVEVGYLLAKDVTADVTPANVKSYVAKILPAVEVPDIPFKSMKGLVPADLIAVNVGARGYILGKPVDPAKVDPNKVTGKLVMNGKDVGKAIPGRAAMGDQWKALAWTLNNARAHGGLLKKGMFIITGSLGPLYPGKPGSYKAVYTGGLSDIAFSIK
jgi:2-keto-4-pentenoate hydratase